MKTRSGGNRPPGTTGTEKCKDEIWRVNDGQGSDQTLWVDADSCWFGSEGCWW